MISTIEISLLENNTENIEIKKLQNHQAKKSNGEIIIKFNKNIKEKFNSTEGKGTLLLIKYRTASGEEVYLSTIALYFNNDTEKIVKVGRNKEFEHLKKKILSLL